MDDRSASSRCAAAAVDRIVEKLPDFEDAVGGAADEALLVGRDGQTGEGAVGGMRRRRRKDRVGQVTRHATRVDVPDLKERERER